MNLKFIFSGRSFVFFALALALPQTLFGQTNYYWQTIATNVSFNADIQGLGVDPEGNLYVANTSDDDILKARDLGANWVVIRIAGISGVSGTNDGVNSVARFNQPNSLAVQDSSTIYVADTQNNTIRELQFDGLDWNATTIAGNPNETGPVDGTNQNALFDNPSGIALDGQGNLYVSEESSDVIRKMQHSGTNWIVTTIAGQAFNSGSTDGTNLNAQFAYPFDVAATPGGTLYVADYSGNAIREIVPIGTNWVTTTIGGDGSENFLDGTNTTSEFDGPASIAVDNVGNVYVADAFNNAIRKLSPAGGTNWVTRTIGGSGSNGGAPIDGTNVTAQFSGPEGVATDISGNIYVADTGNNALRVGYLFPPSLQFVLAGNQATLSYPASLGTNFGFILQAATNLQNPVWLDTTNQWLLTTNNIPYNNLPVTNTIPNRFFRLELP
jgi:sugar lactone lactonase YvrE